MFFAPILPPNIGFIDSLNKLVKSESKDEAVKLVYDFFGNLIIKGELEECNNILGMIKDENYPVWILIPFLTLTRPYDEDMSNRKLIFEQLKSNIYNVMSKEYADITINRLKPKK